MRKIERQMLQAIVDDRSHWSKDNTRVELKDGIHSVWLHGHRIAEYEGKTSKLWINNCGYETVTTKSRLNVLIDFVLGGIGNGIYQKNWNWFLTRNGVDEDFPSNEWVAL
jgi:hypothetical protein